MDSALIALNTSFYYCLFTSSFPANVPYAFPETSPGTKDYVEDMSFVPFGYFIMFAWLAIMITAMILLRKNKANFLSFIIPWFMGLVGCLTVVFVIL